MMDEQQVGQSRITIEVSIVRYSVKFWEQEGHLILSVFTMVIPFGLLDVLRMDSMNVPKLYQFFSIKSRV
jgi:hypothetical protein